MVSISRFATKQTLSTAKAPPGMTSSVKHNKPSIKSTQKLRPSNQSATMQKHLAAQARPTGYSSQPVAQAKTNWAAKVLV